MTGFTTMGSSIFDTMVNTTVPTRKTVLTLSPHDLLDVLEREELSSSNIFAVFFLAILMVLGVVGNIHALVVYYMCYVPSNRRTFILWLAVVDFLNCMFVIPFSMDIAINKYTQTSAFSCKFFYYFGTLFSGYSLVVLDIIAVDRLRRVAFPLKRQLRPRQVNIINAIFCVICIILALPSLYNKTAKLKTLPGGIVGSMCLNDMSTVKRRKFVKFTGVLMTTLFFIFVLFCIIMYMIILCALGKYKHTMHGSFSSKSSTSGSISSRKTSWVSLRMKRKGSVISNKSSEDSEADIPEKEHKNNEQNTTKAESNGNTLVTREENTQQSITENPNTNILIFNSNDDLEHETTPMKPRSRPPPLEAQDSRISVRTRGSTRRIDRGRKTTMIFLVASLISCFGFLPNFAISIFFIFFSAKSGVHGLGVLEPARRFFMAMSYINSVVNPIVYCFMDRKFRLECVKFYSRLKKKIT